MKKSLIALAISTIITLSACHEQGPAQPKTTSADSYSHFIVVDTANKMLNSYLNSINYTDNDTDVQSLIVDVHQLRKYIDSIPGSDTISHIKLMFAHTLNYANSSHAGTNAGYNSNALTVIISAYGPNGTYMFYSGNMVLDYTQPCPPICPAGQAGSPLLPEVRK